MDAQDTNRPFADTDAIAAKISVLRDEMRAMISRIDDLQGKAMLETGAEVLGGLRQAFVDYAEGTEEAWQR